MTQHTVGTPDEWRAARRELLDCENYYRHFSRGESC